MDYGCDLSCNTNADDRDGHNPLCVAGWHCATAFMHTEGGTKDEFCWSSYRCGIAYV